MKNGLKSLIRLSATALLLSMGMLVDAVLPKPAAAAEELRLTIGGPFVFSVSVDSLETFAETGEINQDLRLLTRFLGEDTLNQIRQSLQAPIPYSVTQIDNILYSNLGRDALQNLGKIIQPDPGINGLRGLRGAMITAAAQAGPEGWTLIDVLRAFPTRSADVSGPELLTLKRSLDVYFSYNSAVVNAIQAQAEETASKQAPANINRGLDQPGPYEFERSTLTLYNSAIRQTNEGIRLNYDFNVETYLPQGLLEPAPVVIISHGFGDIQDSFDFLAAHLASHGFAVVLPDHVGSDLGVRQSFLQGNLNTILSPTEFISRPQEVSFVISELDRLVETSPDWAAKLNLNKIGMVGDSLGATTALASAGAEINFNRISRACDSEAFILNLAQYLLCQARFLPPISSQLSDPRITAAIASHAMGGGLYGPEGIGQIEIPLMMVSGSQDIVAPTAAEQVHPFIWASSEEKYLALLSEGTHFTAKPGRPGGSGGIISLFVGENRDIGTRYFKALNVAFWNLYLKEQASYRPYLSARYGQQISEGEPLKLDIIQELTPAALVEAYGQEPPIAIIPEPVTASLSPAKRQEDVLTEIQRTGILKVALRQDSFPFGYVDTDSNWRGYCRAFAADLQTELNQIINSPVDVQLVELASTQESRYSLVRDSHVHLECGPNAIRTDIEGVTFSTPLLVSGTQFLSRRSRVDDKVNPRLSSTRVAVLPGTITEQFIVEEFPQAKRVLFSGPTGQSEAVRALAAGEVDVVASAGILSLGEVQRQNLPASEFSLEPTRPLTCEFYGVALPAGDTQWQAFIDDFIARTHTERLAEEVSRNLLDNQLDIVDFCLNQVSN